MIKLKLIAQINRALIRARDTLLEDNRNRRRYALFPTRNVVMQVKLCQSDIDRALLASGLYVRDWEGLPPTEELTAEDLCQVVSFKPWHRWEY